MGIRFGKLNIIYNSITMETIDPSYLSIKKEDIEKYLEEHPMPDDPEYSKEDMIGDITGSSGFYSLPDKIKDDTGCFIADMIRELM